jgi:hypothetical protein
MSWKQYIQCRALVSERYSRYYKEATVAEVSPAGRVKFRWPSGSESWEDSDSYTLVEILPDPRKEMAASALSCALSIPN